MEGGSRRSKASADDTRVALPQDVVDDILLRVPARQLCRFRAVCPSWRCLLSDPSFVKAHAASRPTLILTLVKEGDRINVVDLSGNIVKQIHIPAAVEESALPAHPGPCLLFRAGGRARVVDPDTGAVFTLPSDDYDNPAPYRPLRSTTRADYVLGRDASTGHHKVLRVFTRGRSLEQLYHVLTLRGSDDNQQRQRWRPCPNPQVYVKQPKVDIPGVTIQGFVYFLAGFTTYDDILAGFTTYEDILHRENVRGYKKMKFVVSFDLEKEQWTTFQAPTETNTGSEAMELVKLSNTLVLVHCNSYRSSVDLWFAQDLAKNLWVKKHCIQEELLAPSPQAFLESDIMFFPKNKVKLLMELDDGRIIFSCYDVTWTQEGSCWRTRVYDPRDKACMDFPQIDRYGMIGVYKESLLYLLDGE